MAVVRARVVRHEFCDFRFRDFRDSAQRKSSSTSSEKMTRFFYPFRAQVKSSSLSQYNKGPCLRRVRVQQCPVSINVNAFLKKKNEKNMFEYPPAGKCGTHANTWTARECKKLYFVHAQEWKNHTRAWPRPYSSLVRAFFRFATYRVINKFGDNFISFLVIASKSNLIRHLFLKRLCLKIEFFIKFDQIWFEWKIES